MSGFRAHVPVSDAILARGARERAKWVGGTGCGGVFVRAWVSRVILVVVLSMVAGVWPAAGDSARAAPGPDKPSVVVSPHTVRVGDVMTIRGSAHSGCPRDLINVRVDFAVGATNLLAELIVADLWVRADDGYAFTLRYRLAREGTGGPESIHTECADPGADGLHKSMALGLFKIDYVSHTFVEPPNPDAASPPADLASKRVVLRPESGPPGSRLTVWTDIRCGGANPTNNVVVLWGDDPMAFFEAGPDSGSQAIVTTVPQGPQRGPRPVSVRCAATDVVVPGDRVPDAGAVLSAVFDTPSPVLTATPARAGPGERVRVRGTGFTACGSALASERPELVVTAAGRILGRLPVAADGRVDADLTLPADAGDMRTPTVTCAGDAIDGVVPLALTLAAVSGDALAPRTSARYRAASTAAVPAVTDLLREPAPVIAAGAVTAASLPLVGFAGELFNRTLEENRARIRRRLRPGAARPRSMPRAPRLQVVVFVVLSALFAAAVEPGVALDVPTGLLALALVVAVPATVLAYTGTAEAYRRRISRVRAFPQLIPGGLAVAVALGVASRAAELTPGYVYGLCLAFTHAGLRTLPDREEGRATLLGATALAGLGMLAWIWRIPVHHSAGQDPSAGWAFAENVLTQTYIAAVMTLFFGLLPIRYLDGHRVWVWNRAGWAVLYAFTTFLFVLTLLDPTGATAGGTGDMWLRSVWIFGGFAAASLTFWAVFRFRPALPPTS